MNWSNPNAWRDFATGAAPASVDATDTLVFDPNQMVGGVPGSNRDGTDDLGFVPLAGLDVENAYTGTNTLNTDLTVTVSAFIANGVLRGPRAFTLGSGAVFTWAGGTLQLNATLSSGSTTSINGAAGKTLTGNLTDSGSVIWSGTGNITANGTITVTGGATFDVKNDATLFVAAGGAASIVNQGTFKKSGTDGPAPQTTIAADFDNQGQFQLNTGALVFNGAAKQSAAAAITTLSNGTLLSASPTFFLDAGALYSGFAQFNGILSNGDPALPGSGGTLHLGLSSGNPATLTVVGTYVQEPGGTLYVEVTNGGIGLLQVQAGGGLPGNANVAGTVTFHRDPSQAPSGPPRTFLTAAQINGLFNAPPNSDPVNDSWIDPSTGQRVKFKSAQPLGTTAYQVTIG